MMTKIRMAGALAAATLSLAGLGAVSPADASEAAPAAVTSDGVCNPGDACIVNAAGTVVYDNPGNANPNVTVPSGGYVWNRGTRFPGADHIQLRTRTASGNNFTICLHYGNSPVFVQPDPTAGTLLGGETVLSWRWRGECVGTEDEWHIV
jgi:hypothetical protein